MTQKHKTDGEGNKIAFDRLIALEYFGGDMTYGGNKEIQNYVKEIQKQDMIFPEQIGMAKVKIEAILRRMDELDLYNEKLDLWAKQNNVDLNAPDSKIPNKTIREASLDSMNQFLKDPKLFKTFDPQLTIEPEVEEPTEKEKKRQAYINVLSTSPKWNSYSDSTKQATLDSLDIFLADPTNLKSFMPKYIKDQQPSGPQSRTINIHKSMLPDYIQDQYDWSAGDNIDIKISELNSIGRDLNKKWDYDERKFIVKNRFKYNQLLSEFKQKVENGIQDGNFEPAKNRADKIIKIYPNISDSLYQVIETAKTENPQEGYLQKLWKMIGWTE